MNKRVVLITTGQPSVNPRIVKEADILQEKGYSVTVLYCYWIQWAAHSDQKLLKQAQWKAQLAGGAPHEKKFLYLFTRLRFKLSRLLNEQFTAFNFNAERAQSRCYDELLREAKKIKADWYIGHNLGALAVAVKAAQHHKANCGFDYEDYHRGENEPIAAYEKKRIQYLEEKYITQVNYLSFSSLLIRDMVLKNFPGFTKPAITLLNCFPAKQQPPFLQRSDDTLQLFWFSQTVGKNRGLELLLDALRVLRDPSIHLTLAGRCDDEALRDFEARSGEVFRNIHFAGIVPPDELPLFASRFDIGLALEPAFSENNDIALSNKIFTYLLAGNAIIFSETAMQKKFNDEHHAGCSFPLGDKSSLIECIMHFKDTGKLLIQRRHNYALAANEMNWEHESLKLLSVLEPITAI